MKSSDGSARRRRVSSIGRSTSARQAATVEAPSRRPSSHAVRGSQIRETLARVPMLSKEDRTSMAIRSRQKSASDHVLVERQQADARQRDHVGELELHAQDHPAG